MQRIVHVESSFNPYAIGVVGGRLDRQPQNADEAIATARWLQEHGYNFSVGLAQVNKHNFAKYGLTLDKAFDACANLNAGSEILKDCYQRARKAGRDEQAALRDSFSCYYSGNFIAGYKLGYVLKVVTADTSRPVVPQLRAAKRAQPDVKNSLVSPIKINGDQKATQASSPPSEPNAPTPQSISNSALLF